MVCISELCIEWNLGLTIVVEVLRLYPPVLVFFFSGFMKAHLCSMSMMQPD